MAEKHALIIRFKYGSTDLSQLEALEDELIAAIEAAHVGDFDGNDVAADGSEATLYMYGPDADKLFEAVRTVLERNNLTQGALATKRYGSARNGAPEARVIVGN